VQTAAELPSPAVVDDGAPVQVTVADDEDWQVLRVVRFSEPSWAARPEIPAALLARYEAARAEWVDAQNAVRQYLGREPVPDEWLWP